MSNCNVCDIDRSECIPPIEGDHGAKVCLGVHKCKIEKMKNLLEMPVNMAKGSMD